MTIFKSFLIAFLFSSSIYFEYFNISNIYINTILALISISLLFNLNKKELFYSGFFIGILWFWWIGISFQYYNLSYLIPLIILAIGLIYGLIFYTIGLIDSIFYKIITIFLLSFISPFGFNWFKPELLFINTIFNINKIDYFLIILSIGLSLHFKKYYYLLLLFFAISYKSSVITPSNLKIFMPQYYINQDIKWEISYQNKLIKINLDNIKKAIKDKYDLVILPETIFPLPINANIELLNQLKILSEDITIVVGALELDDNKYYNSTYLINKGDIKIARKVVLVPFGEKIPLPKYFVDLINKYFFDGAEDYKPALKPTSFKIKNIKFRNAICFEITTNKIYENLDTKYIIATSNNAWFTPSIEPTLQNLLLKYYAKKYNVIIYHSSNYSENKIIK